MISKCYFLLFFSLLVFDLLLVFFPDFFFAIEITVKLAQEQVPIQNYSLKKYPKFGSKCLLTTKYSPFH